MPVLLDVTEFLNTSGIILDVRSPAEYEQGHIPAAISFPLFSNEERAEVGICYKHQGRDQAVELGFAIAGPKFANFITRAKQLAPERRVRLHCWRGGMRSEAVAWVLEMAGFQVSLLTGGYKAFRRWTHAIFETQHTIVILGGMTGTGKTAILNALQIQGAQVLDLEALANHRGSSYGSLGLSPQPTNEQFENNLALAWANFDSNQPVWIEAESKRIGSCRVPESIFRQMEQAPILEVVRPPNERIMLLLEVYGSASQDELIKATERIHKRLGGLKTQQAIALLKEGKLFEAFEVILTYYDKTYSYDLERRKTTISSIDISGLSPCESAIRLLQHSHQIIRVNREANSTKQPMPSTML
jgi:tRNA 2-selenouridine synthase